MNTYYHGTTLENALAIINSNFKSFKEDNWNCSQDWFYFWSEDKLDEFDECARRQAWDNGSIAAARNNSNNVVIFELKIDKDVEPDYSCQNMEGAYCLPMDDMDISMIQKVYVYPFDRIFAPVTLVAFKENDLFEWKDDVIKMVVDRIHGEDYTEMWELMNEQFDEEKRYTFNEFIEEHSVA